MKRFDYVKDAGLGFARALTRRKKTNLIVLHHVQGNMSVTAVHQLHLGRGHKGIDYNIYVDKDGTVYWGRGLEMEGGHTLAKLGINVRSVGIVCNGDFTRERMGAAQLESLKRVVMDVVRYYGFESVAQIVGHGEVGNTDCPGKFFPLAEVKEYIRNGGKNTLEPEPDSPTNEDGDPYNWRVAVGVLNYRESAGGKVLGQLRRGDLVYLDRLVPEEDWARVKIGGKDGKTVYVWKKYISA